MSELHDLVRDVLADLPEGGDPWDVLESLGLTRIGVPEEHGGSGGTVRELSEVVEELAAGGACTPLAEHATVAWLLSGASHGPVRAGTVAVLPTLRADGDTVRVTVPWGQWASHVLLLPLDGAPPAVVPREATTACAGPRSAVGGAPVSELEVPPAGVHALHDGPGAAAAVARLALLRCAAIVGAARAAHTLTDRHVRAREQFGRPLVRIPAVATDLARIRVELLQAETALDAARAASGSAQAFRAAVAARVVAAAAATEIARLAHQLHGALGITLEYPLHRLTRTLWALRDADAGEERWAVELGGLVRAGGEACLWEELTAVGED